MFRRVVVPLDGSELAERALPQAEALARLIGAPIHVLRVVDLGRLAGQGAWTFGVAPGALQLAVDDEERAARTYVERTKQDVTGRGLVASAEVRQGTAEREIVAAVRADDLLVLATHGRGGLARWYLGSVAEDVARHAPGPVMLVRATAEAAPSGRQAKAVGPTA